MRNSVATMHDQAIVIPRRGPSESQSRLKVPAIDRLDVLRGTMPCKLEWHHIEGRQRSRRARYRDGRAQRERLRQLRMERALQIVLFRARQLQVVTNAQIQREIWLHLPIILNKCRRRVPTVVVV